MELRVRESPGSGWKRTASAARPAEASAGMRRRRRGAGGEAGREETTWEAAERRPARMNASAREQRKEAWRVGLRARGGAMGVTATVEEAAVGGRRGGCRLVVPIFLDGLSEFPYVGRGP